MGKKTDYSYETSLPAHREDESGKQAQKDRILEEMKRLKDGVCLKQIEQFMHLPQSTCSGRMNDLKKDGKIKHDGFMEYEGRLRKKFIIINQSTSIVPIHTCEPEAGTCGAPIVPNHSLQQQLPFGT